jgi:hypothetical protein
MNERHVSWPYAKSVARCRPSGAVLEEAAAGGAVRQSAATTAAVTLRSLRIGMSLR